MCRPSGCQASRPTVPVETEQLLAFQRIGDGDDLAVGDGELRTGCRPVPTKGEHAVLAEKAGFFLLLSDVPHHHRRLVVAAIAAGHGQQPIAKAEARLARGRHRQFDVRSLCARRSVPKRDAFFAGWKRKHVAMITDRPSWPPVSCVGRDGGSLACFKVPARNTKVLAAQLRRREITAIRAE